MLYALTPDPERVPPPAPGTTQAGARYVTRGFWPGTYRLGTADYAAAWPDPQSALAAARVAARDLAADLTVVPGLLSAGRFVPVLSADDTQTPQDTDPTPDPNPTPADLSATTARVLAEQMTQTIAQYGRAPVVQALADALSLAAQEQEQDGHTATPAGMARWAADTAAATFLLGMARTLAQTDNPEHQTTDR